MTGPLTLKRRFLEEYWLSELKFLKAAISSHFELWKFRSVTPFYQQTTSNYVSPDDKLNCYYHVFSCEMPKATNKRHVQENESNENDTATPVVVKKKRKLKLDSVRDEGLGQGC